MEKTRNQKLVEESIRNGLRFRPRLEGDRIIWDKIEWTEELEKRFREIMKEITK